MQPLATLLTYRESKRNLAKLSKKIANRLGNLSSQGASGCTIQGESLFLCPKSIMVGVLGSVRACRILDPVYQPGTSAAQSLVTLGGSLKTTVKELAMSLHSYVTKPSKNNTSTLKVSFKSIFFLIDSNRKTIADSLTFDQVKSLSDQVPNSIIKFQKMAAIS